MLPVYLTAEYEGRVITIHKSAWVELIGIKQGTVDHMLKAIVEKSGGVLTKNEALQVLIRMKENPYWRERNQFLYGKGRAILQEGHGDD